MFFQKGVVALLAAAMLLAEQAHAQDKLAASGRRQMLRRTNHKKTSHKKKHTVPAAVDVPPATVGKEELVQPLPPITDNARTEEEDPIVHVTIGLTEIEATEEHPDFVLPTLPANEKTPLIAQQIEALSDDVQIEQVIPQIKMATVSIHKSKLKSLQANKKVDFVETIDDVEIYEDTYLDGETIPQGVNIISGPQFPVYHNSPAECTNPDSIKVAVLDGGLDVGHWDFEWCGVNPLNGEGLPGREVRCMGQAFLPAANAANGEDWYNSRRSHGVHVAGSIGASGRNGKGVLGSISDEGFCLMVMRVFGDDGRISVSQLEDAIVQSAQLGARVITMSLGTKRYLHGLHNAIKGAQQLGAILVGSGGNRGDNSLNYPASFPEVTAVAAVENDGTRAWFSNYGDYISISAPGVGQLSTEPRWDDTPFTTIERVNGDGTVYEGGLFQYTDYIGIAGVEGPLKNCGSIQGRCPGQGGHICLISKTDAPFHTLARRCSRGGGIAAIIINDSEDQLRGRMEVISEIPQYAAIPVIGVTASTGVELRRQANPHVMFSLKNPLYTDPGVLAAGYSRKSGTSMAAPLVAGALGSIWRQCPLCKSNEVMGCLLDTAEPLGDEQEFGRGLLQAATAAQCLSANTCCSTVSENSVETLTPSTAPTPSPSESPTTRPSSSPTRSPTRFPSASPIVHGTGPCHEACASKHKFCTFRVSAVCTNSACTGLCVAAVNSGEIGAEFLGKCRSEWCPEDVPCGATTTCDAAKTVCEASCGV
mmetsp:Transcript_20285/g.43874  ORF Transcript_20285/g.43874 Transcript_20285/m.43874 type:complete len:762 (-) Transcript_20285:417-2702(-)|eukprot:CAMPEP_0168749866 /NCGR_PEP_ID=MMETSP0724-20121128/16955_1 /TAXON_ID=265536 /ORGANISM="Amphiprora sp., Strain CCMP467" /LENGTH=761 /DNA_ID=CAMNT_0008797825 /DNA_START=58 /DNA_END=2343 /DNA_ORIENTATION=-